MWIFIGWHYAGCQWLGQTGYLYGEEDKESIINFEKFN